jgi:hypothetical protein
MKSLIKGIFYFVILITLIGCEETVDDMELPYIEQMVIRCILEADKPVVMSITKTLPPLEEYNIDNAKISNVSGYIQCEGNIYPVSFKDGIYYEFKDLIPKIGKAYSLVLNWNGKTAKGKTWVPEPIVIDTVYKNLIKNDDYWYFYFWEIIYSAEFKPHPNSAYTAYTWTETGSNYLTKYYSDYAKKWNDINLNGKISLPFSSNIIYDPSEFTSVREFDVGVDCYDIPFYDYFITRYEGNSLNDLFSTSGQNIYWNIEGDGIGLFLGFSSFKKHVKL